MTKKDMPAPLSFAEETANILLNTKAVLLSPESPFTLTSGRKSPVYVDCRKLIAFPQARKRLIEMAEMTIYHKIGHDQFDVVAGGETAGIPYAAFLAQTMNLSMCYIRKKPKGFGRNARIEGDLQPNQRVLMVEDMTTDGGSKLSFIEGLREAEAICHHCFVIFEYGIFPKQMSRLAEHDLHLISLANWWDVLAMAKARQLLPHKSLDMVEEFLHNPDGWDG